MTKTCLKLETIKDESSFSESTNDGSDDYHLVSSSTNGADKPTNISDTIVRCQFCNVDSAYKNYTRHCRLKHPNSPWRNRVKCLTCKRLISGVNFNFHREIFGHKEETETAIAAGNEVKEPNDIERKIAPEINNTKKYTRIPCEFCSKDVRLYMYVKHCKKFHSISDENESCRRKCRKCGANVHAIAEKFHCQIYHQ